MLDHQLLASTPVFTAKRQAAAARLTVHPQPGFDAGGLAAALAEAWPAELGALWLNVAGEAALTALHTTPLPEHVWLEVPAFMASELPATATPRLVKGQQLARLTPEVLGRFAHALVDAGDAPPALPWSLAGAQTVTEAHTAWQAGARHVVGWPLGEAPDGQVARKDIPASVAVVMELMQLVDQDANGNQLEAVLRRDPALAYRLLRYINSPGFGLSVEITSFQHALMVLGYGRLKRWLALLMTSAIDAPDLKPLLTLAVQRGLLMEQLARASGDAALGGELFICGVFSLLDRMLGQPFAALLPKLPVPEAVAQALDGGSGPHHPWLNVALAVEAGLPLDVRAGIDALMMAPTDLNAAVLASLRGAWQMRVD